MRKILSKKTKSIIKKFAEDELEVAPVELDDQAEGEENEDGEPVQGKRLTMKSVISKVLAIKPKKSNPIMSENQRPMKLLIKEKEESKLYQLKKKIKKQVSNRGHVDPSLHNNKTMERELKVTCAKGVMKVLQALKKVQLDLSKQ